MPNRMPLPERRVHRRKKSAIGAKIDNVNTSSYFTHLRDISRNGAFIHTFINDTFHIGQELIVSFPFQIREEIVLISRVARINSDGIGVKFVRRLRKSA